ncbi:WXG100-like domain-containing protein [Nonomuraea sp. NPDC003707]
MSPSPKSLPMGGFAFSALGVGAVVLQMLSVAYPDGDPAKAREAARLLRQLATRVDTSLDDVEDVARTVWRPPSSGAGVDAFRKYFNEDLAPYPPHVSAYLRGLADAVDDYADMLEQTQHALHTMAMIQWLELLMFFCWPAIDKKVQVLINWAMRRRQAGLLLKLFNHAVGKRFIYAVGGSLAYTALDQLLVDGVKLGRGEDMGSWGDRGEYMVKNFAACMVFYHVDPANFKAAANLLSKNKAGKNAIEFLGKGANLLPKNKAAQDAMWFLTGSSIFTSTANALNRPGDVIDDPASLLPTWEQMLAKLGVAAGQDQFRRWRGY